MAPYLAAHGGRWEGAVRLYDWNTSVGAAFFESIHYLEVGLRNAVDDAASARLGTGWLSPISPVLTPLTQGCRAGAALRRRAERAAREAHRRVAVRLLVVASGRRIQPRLWQPALQYAFEGPVRRRRLHAKLDDLRRLRNRIAHHEPIHGRALYVDFANVLDIATRVGTVLGEHIAATSRVPDLLAGREQAS